MAWSCFCMSMVTIIGVIFTSLFIVALSDPTRFMGSSAVHRIGPADLGLTYQLESVETLRNKSGQVTSTKTLTAPGMTQRHPGYCWLLIDEIPTMIFALALLQATEYFRGILRGRAFEARTVRCLRGFVLGSLLYLITWPFALLLPNLFERMANPATHFTSITTSDQFHNVPGLGDFAVPWGGILLWLFIGALVVVAWAMGQAVRLAEENSQII